MQNRFSRWPSWIYNQNDFSYFLSTSCPDILSIKFDLQVAQTDSSYQVLNQLAFRFRRRSTKLIFKMVAILDFRQNYFSYLKSTKKKVREKSRECHNHKPQPFPDPKRKLTNPNKHKSNRRTKSTKISSLFSKRGNRNTKRTEKHKNKRSTK